MIDPAHSPPDRPRSSGWAWFWAGSTLSLATMLGGLLYGLLATGLYTDLLARLGPGGRLALTEPTVIAQLAPTPVPAITTPAPTVPTAAAQPSPTAAATPTARPAAAATPSRPSTVQTARVGELIASAAWKMVVNEIKTINAPTGVRRAIVDFTIKNDADRADTVAIPATIALPPRTRPAADVPIQMMEPPALQMQMLDRAERQFGGGFVSANGQPSGSFTFEAAPRDAIRLTYGFDLPASSAEPFVLDLSFGAAAGGARVRVPSDERASAPVTLVPSDPPKSASRDERLLLPNLWAFTLVGLDVGAPGGDGERSVTARLRAENLTDRSLLVGASLDDPTGAARDFYAVDTATRVAYSSGDTIPRTNVPAGATRMIDVKLKAPSEFATSGPYRVSIVVDARKDRYAVFKLP